MRIPIDIERLLIWAFLELDAVSGGGLGAAIDAAWSDGEGFSRGSLPLPDLVNGYAGTLDHDAERICAAIRTLERQAADLIVAAARSGHPPDWMDGRYEVWRRRARIYPLDDGRVRAAWQGAPACLPAMTRRLNGAEIPARLLNAGNHVVGCAVVHIDRTEELVRARRRYGLWRCSLVELRQALAPDLERWLPTGPSAHVAPWYSQDIAHDP